MTFASKQVSKRLRGYARVFLSHFWVFVNLRGNVENVVKLSVHRKASDLEHGGAGLVYRAKLVEVIAGSLARCVEAAEVIKYIVGVGESMTESLLVYVVISLGSSEVKLKKYIYCDECK